MTRKGYQTRLSGLASILLLLLAVCARRGSAQANTGAPVSFSSEDIAEIVALHNELRGMVDPPASNMQAVMWDSELAAAALEFSQRCRLESNPMRASQVTSFDTVGENFSAAGTSNANYSAIIVEAWFNQRAVYNFTQNTCTTPGACSFYTQLVWANSVAVGCGASICPDIEPNFPVSDSTIFFCYYGPAGNIPGERPYETGQPCSSCLIDQVCVDNVCTTIPTTQVTTAEVTTPPITTPPLQTTPTTEAPTTPTEAQTTPTEAPTTPTTEAPTTPTEAPTTPTEAPTTPTEAPTTPTEAPTTPTEEPTTPSETTTTPTTEAPTTPTETTTTPTTKAPTTPTTITPSTPKTNKPTPPCPPSPPSPPKPPCPSGFILIQHPYLRGYRKFTFRCRPGPKPPNIPVHIWKKLLELKKKIWKKLLRLTPPPPTSRPFPAPSPSPKPRPEKTKTKSRSRSKSSRSKSSRSHRTRSSKRKSKDRTMSRRRRRHRH